MDEFELRGVWWVFFLFCLPLFFLVACIGVWRGFLAACILCSFDLCLSIKKKKKSSHEATLRLVYGNIKT